MRVVGGFQDAFHPYADPVKDRLGARTAAEFDQGLEYGAAKVLVRGDFAFANPAEESLAYDLLHLGGGCVTQILKFLPLRAQRLDLAGKCEQALCKVYHGFSRGKIASSHSLRPFPIDALLLSPKGLAQEAQGCDNIAFGCLAQE